MSKGKVLALVVITLLALVGVAGYIGFRFTDSQVTIGQSITTDSISRDSIGSFSGVVKVEQVIYIYNSGTLDIQNIVVDVTVFFTGNLDPDEVEIGDGINNLGSVPAGDNVSKTIIVELNNKIPRLAVEDGTFRIVIETSLSLQFVPFSFDLPQQETTEQWEAPFTP